MENIALHELPLYFLDNSKNIHHELLWNVLGIFYQNIDASKEDSSSRIDYTVPQEYIWVRRGNLHGAVLKIGYVGSPPYLREVNPEKDVLTGYELTSGNTVNKKIDYTKIQKKTLISLK